MNKNILLEDKLALTESELHTVTAGGSPQQNKTFRTRIDAFDQFGDPIFTRLENNVVLGGSIYVLEKLFNVRSGLQVDTLNNIMTINNATPAFGATANIPQDHCICLWGIGTGGSGDAIGTVKDVKFYEREVGSNGVSSEMIPFRVTDTDLVGAEAENYWFKKDMGSGKKGYLRSSLRFLQSRLSGATVLTVKTVRKYTVPFTTLTVRMLSKSSPRCLSI